MNLENIISRFGQKLRILFCHKSVVTACVVITLLRKSRFIIIISRTEVVFANDCKEGNIEVVIENDVQTSAP